MIHLDEIISKHEAGIKLIRERKEQERLKLEAETNEKHQFISKVVEFIIEPVLLSAQETLFNRGYSSGINKTDVASEKMKARYHSSICLHLNPVKTSDPSREDRNTNKIMFSFDEDSPTISISYSLTETSEAPDTASYSYDAITDDEVENLLTDFITCLFNMIKKQEIVKSG